MVQTTSLPGASCGSNGLRLIMTDTLRSALYSVSPEDRDTWVEIGMALKSELGDGGFALWDEVTSIGV